ncbi:hypothetical protein BpHYR1_045028 [Brachionus plicatilis]|uniref:Uncharacterized protein n=1 Tax=Brachionus plicatilis TaxID=10195 RepID=A0A3M7PG41_BRAPC|nr:hypothetical protein BpHYR1_045028 [Brachionus plicatilis]
MHKYIMALMTVFRDQSKTIVNGKKQSEQTQAFIEDEEKVKAKLKALKLDRSKTVKRFRRIKSNRSIENRSEKELDMIVVEFNEESSKRFATPRTFGARSTLSTSIQTKPPAREHWNENLESNKSNGTTFSAKERATLKGGTATASNLRAILKLSRNYFRINKFYK